jgi:isoprenylcysteine carboxyl methyltransferase (ICMT) family protein YpbQ
MKILLVLFIILVLLRFYSLAISIRNEKKLKSMGAIEYGHVNSLILTIAHILFYLFAMVEGLKSHLSYKDNTSEAGLIIYSFGICMLYYVISAIRHVWTVKLYIASEQYHTINKSFLFRFFRHPNYFLNIIPELVGYAMFFHAWSTLSVGLPIYLIPLTIRIIQEEKLMKKHFFNY